MVVKSKGKVAKEDFTYQEIPPPKTKKITSKTNKGSKKDKGRFKQLNN